MSDDADRRELAELGARSVFEYIERTALHDSFGTSWKTLSLFESQSQRVTDAGMGVSGVSLFLSDYSRLFGDESAAELALGGLRWCDAPASARSQEFEVDHISSENLDKSLAFGWAGLGKAWLHYSIATNDSQGVQRATVFANRLVESDPGPLTGFMYGASGEGTFLLRLREECHDDRFLNGAHQYGEWLANNLIEDGTGCYWSWNVDMSEPLYGIFSSGGLPGIGYFLLLLCQATHEERWAELARKTAIKLTEQARPDRDGLNWPITMNGPVSKCQWCCGAPGVGMFYVKAYEVLGESSYLETAAAAGETTFAYGDVRQNPIQCHGLSGNAELFVELYRATKDEMWLDRAFDFGERTFAYRQSTGDGDLWQGDEPGIYSPAYMNGAAGVGHFFLRLLAPAELRMPFY